MDKSVSTINDKLLEDGSNPALVPATNQEVISYSSSCDCANYHNHGKRLLSSHTNNILPQPVAEFQKRLHNPRVPAIVKCNRSILY